MWTLLTPLLIKYGIPLAISILEETGAINATESFMVKAWIGSKNIHPSYTPADFPEAPPIIKTPNNLNQG